MLWGIVVAAAVVAGVATTVSGAAGTDVLADVVAAVAEAPRAVRMHRGGQCSWASRNPKLMGLLI